MSLSGKQINNELIMRNAPSFSKRKNEPLEVSFSRITHLNLNEKGIEVIENLEICNSLQVLYLYDNHINEIDNLLFATHLTHLYLQNNNIAVIEGIPTASLQKLFLDDNRIAVISGLETASHLTELHIANQKSDEGEAGPPLAFDPASCSMIGRTLIVLNISGNRLTEECINFVLMFVRLENLNISKNNINDVNGIVALLSLRFLLDLDTRGNPVCRQHNYEQAAWVACSARLKKFDNKDIVPSQRQMLLNLQAHKMKTKSSINSRISRALSDNIDSKASSTMSLGSFDKAAEMKEMCHASSSRIAGKNGIAMSSHFDMVNVASLPFKEQDLSEAAEQKHRSQAIIRNSNAPASKFQLSHSRRK